MTGVNSLKGVAARLFDPTLFVLAKTPTSTSTRPMAPPVRVTVTMAPRAERVFNDEPPTGAGVVSFSVTM